MTTPLVIGDYKGQEIINNGGYPEKITTIMILNDVKVARYFGKRPWLGKPIPGARPQMVTVGWKFTFGKMKPNDKVIVQPTMSLKRLKNYDKGCGLWEVTVEKQHLNTAVAFLMQRCG